MRIQYAVLSLCLITSLISCGRDEQKPEGEKLLELNGCTACHSLDGTKGIGPTLKGLYGKDVVVITDGAARTVKADREYLKRSIIDPRADVVEGFKSTMPVNFKNQLGEKNLHIILDYLEFIGSEKESTEGSSEK